MLKTRALSVPPVLIALCLGAATFGAESPEPGARPQKSVRGTLDSVDKRLGGIGMTTDKGERVAWKFSPAVIAEVAKFAKGAPMIVIYRQIAPNEKRVTAVAFPGTAEKPTYVNLTGGRIAIRSSAAGDDACVGGGAGPVSESVIPAGGRAEVLDGCWCCAPSGETCVPTTKTGQGQAFLERCFE
jgi:hypothetical protein